MNDFWNGKTLPEVVKSYLNAALDECVDMQPMNIDGLVKELCGNMTIKNNAKGFVADYFDDAINTVIACAPDSSFRYSQYEHTAHLMLVETARKLLNECETAKEYDETYHIWRKGDIEALKEDLEDVVIPGPSEFQRACDVSFESLESYAYRFLDYALPKMAGKTIQIKDLALEMPLVSLSDADSRRFLKCNFEESMELLDKFRDSGYKVDYTNPTEMMQNIMYQKQKEILSENPYMIDLIDYTGVDRLTLDENFIDDLRTSLSQQNKNIKLSKFEELPSHFNRATGGVASNLGRTIDFRKSHNRVEIIY